MILRLQEKILVEEIITSYGEVDAYVLANRLAEKVLKKFLNGSPLELQDDTGFFLQW